MNFEELSKVVNQYLNKLEQDFKQENYEYDFIIQKLDNYIYAFHQDIRFKLSEESGTNMRDIEAVEQQIQKPHIEPIRSLMEEKVKARFKGIIDHIESFEHQCRRKYSSSTDSPLSIIIGSTSPNRDEIMYLERLLIRSIEGTYNFSIKNSKIEMYIRQIVSSFEDGKFNDVRNWERIRNSKIKDIIDEVTNIFKMEEKRKLIGEVFNTYREYLSNCIDVYKMVSKLEINTPSKENKEKPSPKQVVDYIEIHYSNGEKKKVSFRNICTPDGANYLEERINEIIRLSE